MGKSALPPVLESPRISQMTQWNIFKHLGSTYVVRDYPLVLTSIITTVLIHCRIGRGGQQGDNLHNWPYKRWV